MILSVAGKTIEATRIDGASPPLVFLHEGLGSALQWRDFPARIAKETGRGAFAYSRLGYGASDPVSLPRPLDYMQREAIDFLPRVLDAAGIDDAILIGHSDGGSIALVFAAVHPSRTRALVVLAPHVFVEDLSVASIAKAKAAYETGDLRARLAKHHAHVDVAFRGWNDAWLDAGFRSWNIEEYLPRIAAPVLAIQGEDDPYGTRAQIDAIAQQAGGPVETLMLPGSGHAPQRDRGDEAASAIVRFVRTSAPS
jgi:pimeloyl-ACP methyl ester carboxylesterase